MENASKALIIAGAILLSILLISLGIRIFNNAKGAANNANIDSKQAQAFNEKISQYCGDDKSASAMNSLMNVIAASNGAQSGKDNPHPIKVTYDGKNYGYEMKNGSMQLAGTFRSRFVTTTTKEYPFFDSGKTYDATYTYAEDGYINVVNIN